MIRHSFPVQSLLVAMFAVALAGCGGGSDIDLAAVKGTITLDGNPLPGARVVFTPAGGGRPALGMTDDNGKYTLEYSSTNTGTPPGDYIVSIRTYQASEEDPDSGQMTEAVPETVPAAYHSPSTLTVTVPSESYDFKLESSAGDVVQPKLDPTVTN